MHTPESTAAAGQPANTITIDLPALKHALERWETSARAGETLPFDEARQLSIQETADRSAAHLWELLGGAA